MVLRPQINMYFKTCTHTKRLPLNNTQIKILNLEILKGCYLLNLVICCLGMSSLEQLFVVICLKIICSKWQGAVLTFDEGTNLIWRCWYDLYLPKATPNKLLWWHVGRCCHILNFWPSQWPHVYQINGKYLKGTQLAVRIDFFVYIKSCQYLMFYNNKMFWTKCQVLKICYK